MNTLKIQNLNLFSFPEVFTEPLERKIYINKQTVPEDKISISIPLKSLPINSLNIKSDSHTLKKAEELYEKRKLRIRKLRDLPSHFDSVHEEYAGIPSATKLVNPDGIVLRHYFQNEETMNKVIKSEFLIAGPTPYVEQYPRYKREYSDLKGIFFTTPDTKPADVGVPFSKYYVDIILPKDTGLLELEKTIFMVPGEAKTPEWAVRMYEEKYKKGLPVPEADIPYMDYLDRNGIAQESTKAYVNIISSGKI